MAVPFKVIGTNPCLYVPVGRAVGCVKNDSRMDLAARSMSTFIISNRVKRRPWSS